MAGMTISAWVADVIIERPQYPPDNLGFPVQRAGRRIARVVTQATQVSE
jgi:hypothetical protein